jgi:Protein of unknown function DUF262
MQTYTICRSTGEKVTNLNSIFTEDPNPLENESDLSNIIASSLSSTVTQSSDWTISTLLDLIKRNRIALNPDFQRRDAWQSNRKAKFIESILLGFPVPQIVLAESKNDRGKFIIIDGKQRLLALVSAFGINSEEAGLKAEPLKLVGFDIIDIFNNKTLFEIQEMDYYRSKLEDFDTRTIRTVVIRNWENEDILYHIFLRLNTGSVQLSPQELRNALHPGPFAKFVDDRSSQSGGLRRILGIKKPDFRMRDAELFLRYYAFATSITKYTGSIKQFLDDITNSLNSNWEQERQTIEELADHFEESVSLVYEIFGENAFRKRKGGEFESRFNRAVFDVMLYYFSDPIIRTAASTLKHEIFDGFVNLSDNDPEFVNSMESTTKSLTSTSYRLSKWGETLSSIIGAKLDVPQLENNRIVIK